MTKPHVQGVCVKSTKVDWEDGSTYSEPPSAYTDAEMADLVATYLQHHARFDVNFDPISRRYTIRLIDKTGKTLLGWAVDYSHVHGRK